MEKNNKDISGIKVKREELPLLSALLTDLAYGEGRGEEFVLLCAENPTLSRYRRALLLQSHDEARHAAIFSGLLGGLPDAWTSLAPSPGLPKFLSSCDDMAKTPAAVVAIHGILETVLASEIRAYREFWRASPVLSLALDSVLKDEIRHAALGRAWMAAHGRKLGLSDLDAKLAGWTEGLGACLSYDEPLASLGRRRLSELEDLLERQMRSAVNSAQDALSAVGLCKTAAQMGGIIP